MRIVLRNKKIIYAAVIGLLLVVVFVPLPSPTLKGKGAVRGAMAPAQRGASSLWRRLSEAAAAVRGIGDAVERTRELELALVRVQTDLDKLRAVEADNARLRRAFNFYHEQPAAMVPVNVIGRDISGWWNSIRIGKGSKDGIRKDYAVISPDGLVGKVAEVNGRTAEVLLLSDPACRISAKIARLDVFGMLRGSGTSLKGHPRARLDFIHKDAEVRIGDEIVTSGLAGDGDLFPQGVHIGYVDKVHQDRSGLYQYAEVVPGATAGLLDYLFVVAQANGEGRP